MFEFFMNLSNNAKRILFGIFVSSLVLFVIINFQSSGGEGENSGGANEINSQHPLDIAFVGDSITFGVGSSDPQHNFPSEFQQMVGEEKYNVSNLGNSGSTLQKEKGHSYWNQKEYQSLIAHTWDVVVIMLGTNDARNINWNSKDECVVNGIPALTSMCQYEKDYTDLIKVCRSLGKDGRQPDVFLAIPPPIMGSKWDMTPIVNDYFPILIPLIAEKNNIKKDHVIDVFSALGGDENWRNTFPERCMVNTTSIAKCPLFCDSQYCDNVHPNNNGYLQMAKTMKESLDI